MFGIRRKKKSKKKRELGQNIGEKRESILTLHETVWNMDNADEI